MDNRGSVCYGISRRSGDQFEIQRVFFQTVFRNLLRFLASDEKQSSVNWKCEDSVCGFVCFYGDLAGGFHILSAKVQAGIAVIDDGHGTVFSIHGVKL